MQRILILCSNGGLNLDFFLSPFLKNDFKRHEILTIKSAKIVRFFAKFSKSYLIHMLSILKWRLDCEVFSANQIGQIDPILSQPHKETLLPND